MHSTATLAAMLAALPPQSRDRVVAQLSPEEQQQVAYLWEVWARPNQLPPDACACHAGDWLVWLILAGRGFGKTRSGAEAVRIWAESGKVERITLAAQKKDDIRGVMLEGESGLIPMSPPWFRPKLIWSKRELHWPNGCIATLISADDPDSFRGPQHEKAWADELAKWKDPEAWDQLLFGLRLGKKPQVVVTTTPKPTPLIKELAKDPTTHVTKGSTYDNRENLAKVFFDKVIKAYEGTRVGRQELNAEILEDNPNALWNMAQIERLRVDEHPDLSRIVVAIDPAVTGKTTSDESGIITAGVGPCRCKCRGRDDKPEAHGFILDDLSGIYTPDGWARRAVNAYRKHKADRIVAEVNNGGDLVEVNIRTVDQHASYKAVHASRGKRIRAEPVAALYEQGKVHHVGPFAKLEDELTGWDPTLGGESPNRLDANVWALTELMLDEQAATYSGVPRTRMPTRRM
jgi:phage terminase large subunit-like protein